MVLSLKGLKGWAWFQHFFGRNCTFSAEIPLRPNGRNLQNVPKLFWPKIDRNFGRNFRPQVFSVTRYSILVFPAAGRSHGWGAHAQRRTGHVSRGTWLLFVLAPPAQWGRPTEERRERPVGWEHGCTCNPAVSVRPAKLLTPKHSACVLIEKLFWNLNRCDFQKFR